MKKSKLVSGVGINDADYSVTKMVDGKRQPGCPYYVVWTSMLVRCYSSRFHSKHLTYRDCTIVKEWQTFSNFRSWMQSQNWQRLHLDKDIIFPGNKVYSPETCIFVSHQVNSLFTDHAAKRGEWPIGVCYRKKIGKFIAQCSDGDGKRIYLGLFDDPSEAHHAYLICKSGIVVKVAHKQPDNGVKTALLQRADDMKNDAMNIKTSTKFNKEFAKFG